jgi:hypothetical protein
MECAAAKGLMSRKIDGELSDLEGRDLDAHLARCASCSRELAFLTLPRMIAQAIPPPAPSPYFCRALMAQIESEHQNFVIWQPFFSLARRVIPSLAGITLALLSVFAYLQLRGTEVDLYTAYASALISDEQPIRMVFAQQGEITDESILSAIAQLAGTNNRNLDAK